MNARGRTKGESLPKAVCPQCGRIYAPLEDVCIACGCGLVGGEAFFPEREY